MRPAFGGVVFNEKGEVLICRPTNRYGGYGWTFPKGGPRGSERPEETALREVREETGWSCRILTPIPGQFAGTTTTNRYFLMQPVAKVTGRNDEMGETRWVLPEDAPALFETTAHETGITRDLAVLQAALQTRAELRATTSRDGGS